MNRNENSKKNNSSPSGAGGLKPSIPQGTRDFSADVVCKRNYIFKTIQNIFELYGFQPLETPAMENLETLTGKYGEEGDKLIFKILNNGLDNTTKHAQAKAAFEKVLTGKSSKDLTERALRYDLTIPFARYVATNFGQLAMPFKRYQIQPVWRADRPQKGRYREFYQCDADIVGSNNLINEVELANIYNSVFSQFGIDVEIKINNRKILAALSALCGGHDKMSEITIAIDKLDKIGMDRVLEELAQRGIAAMHVKSIQQYLSINGSNEEKLDQLKTILGNIEEGKKGISEIEYILNFLPSNSNQQLTVDFTLARGLNYYTGIIFEVKAKEVQIGSIGGGGRYDNLTGLFGVEGISGVGISFGVDRIYDVMEELNLFAHEMGNNTQLLFFNLGEAESKAAYTLMQQLRSTGMRCELYPDHVKFDKQFKYADKKGIPDVVIIGSKELETGTCIVKNLTTGVQKVLTQEEMNTFSI